MLRFRKLRSSESAKKHLPELGKKQVKAGKQAILTVFRLLSQD